MLLAKQKQAQLRQENPEWVRPPKKEKMAESMRAKWADPEFAEKMKSRKRPRKPTPEQMIERIKNIQGECAQKLGSGKNSSLRISRKKRIGVNQKEIVR